ncbi:MAG: hypothetical protein DI623_00920 [Sphingomonas sanxanigenens]|uniref:Uncharacterized protein n=1 Tax=Sphingomonas sanxanigenens TaxID=397260 RepID=A0A2W5CA72_9SPHN|nr:MAG: hypothetical protein DI623_00920 [Sphingomonas sanxanigenens]
MRFAHWIDALASRLTPRGERTGRDMILARGEQPTPSGPDRISLGEEESFVATARLRPGETMMQAIGRVAPIAPAELVWKARRASGPHGARLLHVAMARRTRIDAIAAAYPKTPEARPTIGVTRGDGPMILVAGGAGSSAAARATVKALLAALILLLTIPLTTWAGAKLLTMREARATRAAEARGGGALAAKRQADATIALAARLRPALERESAGALIGRLARALPDGARLATLDEAADGRLIVEVDSSDPDPVRAAFAPLGLKATAQRAVTDRGIRSRFEGRI